MTQQNNATRESVQQHYAQRAIQADSCCGSDSDYSGDKFYAAEISNKLPKDITSFSLGCGDPISNADLKPGEWVLDLGSGGGLDCFLAAKEVGEDGHVIGVDMTSEMLKRARAMAEKLNFGNVEFREGYLEDLPVEDDSIDVVISNCVINLSPDKLSVFKEIIRALKPGGRVSISDILRNGELPEEMMKDSQAWSACVAGALSVQEYSEGLVGAGFEKIEIAAKGDAGEIFPELPEDAAFSALITARKPG